MVDVNILRVSFASYAFNLATCSLALAIIFSSFELPSPTFFAAVWATELSRSDSTAIMDARWGVSGGVIAWGVDGVGDISMAIDNLSYYQRWYRRSARYACMRACARAYVHGSK